MNDMMYQVRAMGTDAAPAVPATKSAGKTGTSADYRDAGSSVSRLSSSQLFGWQ
jgi:membrane peptidoglycan carboxypeptidase